MALKLTGSDFPQLLSWLEHHLPESFKLYQDVKDYLKGQFLHQFPHLQFFVDRWPNPQAVVITLDPAGEQLACKNRYENAIVGVLGLTDAAVIALLEDGNFLDWSKPTRFRGYMYTGFEKDMMPAVMSVIKRRAEVVQPLRCVLLKATPQDLTPRPVPDDTNISSITEDMVDVVDSTWRCSGEGTKDLIRDLVRTYPSVLLTTSSGEHIGHMVGRRHGVMGLLYVQPRFRGRGYARVVISQLAQKFFDRGDNVCVLPVEGSEPSMRLYLSVGFKLQKEAKVSWLWV